MNFQYRNFNIKLKVFSHNLTKNQFFAASWVNCYLICRGAEAAKWVNFSGSLGMGVLSIWVSITKNETDNLY